MEMDKHAANQAKTMIFENKMLRNVYNSNIKADRLYRASGVSLLY